jgi:iron complex outermembrane receptor protein
MRLALPVLALVVATRAGAQQDSTSRADRAHTDSVRPDSVRADSARRIAAVVVTALRTRAALATAPWAVSVRDASETTRGRPGLALDEALRGTGVQVENRYNYALGERIAVRGFGARAQFGVRGVRVIVDGVPATMPDGQTTLNHVDLGTLHRAEVVRGPASSLWGNASGGVILLESAAPPEGAFAHRAAITGGGEGLRRLCAGTGGTTGALGWTLNAARTTYDGYRRHADAENLHANGRANLALGNTRLQLAGAAVQYDARNPGSLNDSLLRVDRRQAFARNVVQRTGERGRHAQLGGAAARAVGAGEVELSGWTLARSLDNPIPTTIIDLDRRAGGARAIYRMDDARVHLAAGVEAEQQRDARRNFANSGGARGALTLDQRERVTTLAAFVQSSQAWGRFTVLGGLRGDRARFSVRDALVTTSDPDDSGARTMTARSEAAGVSYALGRATLYANAATAFETPTTTELANRPEGAGGFNPSLQPQRTRSWELGARGRAGLGLEWDAAAYRAEVRDLLVPFEVPDAPGRQFFRNAGQARHTGAEASAMLRPVRWLQFRASYAWTDAEFRRYTVGEATFDGNRVPGVTPHRAELAATASRASGWFASLESRWASRTMVNDANTASNPAYRVLDARAGRDALRLGRAWLSAFAGVNNLLDAAYNGSLTVNAFGGRYYEPSPGRSLYAGLSLTALPR